MRFHVWVMIALCGAVASFIVIIRYSLLRLDIQAQSLLSALERNASTIWARKERRHNLEGKLEIGMKLNGFLPYSPNRTVGVMAQTSGFCGQANICRSKDDKHDVRVSLDGWAASEFNLGTYSCPRTWCSLSRHTPGQSEYDVLVSALPPRISFPKKKFPQTMRHAELSMESSINHPTTLDPVSYSQNGIDLVVSFRPPVDLNIVQWLPTSYVNAELDAFLSTSVDNDRWLGYAWRDPSMVAMISNCAQKNVKRLDILSGITKSFPRVYTLGGCFESSTQLPAEVEQCLKLPRRSAMWDAPKECVLHYAMFSFSLENSLEQAYMTEKLWQPLKMGAIPIYSTGSLPVNRRFLPHHDAAIFIEDFASLEELAAYMHMVTKNKSLWFKHAMAWRSVPVDQLSKDFLSSVESSLVTLPCRLCDWWLMDTMKADNNASLNACVQEIVQRVRFPQQLLFIDERYGIDSIFVVHYKPLQHRKVEIEHRVRSVFGCSPVFIEDLDKDELSSTDLACVSDRNLQMEFIQRWTKKGEDSLTMKHMAIFSFMLKRNLRNVLVLEDDARFYSSDWLSPSSQWQAILKELPVDYDMVMLSDFGGFSRRGRQIGKHLFLAQASRVSSMYLVSTKGAQNMLKTLPIVGPFDFQINYAAGHGVPTNMPRARVANIKILWAEPAMSDQHDATGAKQTVKAR